LKSPETEPDCLPNNQFHQEPLLPPLYHFPTPALNLLLDASTSLSSFVPRYFPPAKFLLLTRYPTSIPICFG